MFEFLPWQLTATLAPIQPTWLQRTASNQFPFDIGARTWPAHRNVKMQFLILFKQYIIDFIHVSSVWNYIVQFFLLFNCLLCLLLLFHFRFHVGLSVFRFFISFLLCFDQCDCVVPVVSMSKCFEFVSVFFSSVFFLFRFSKTYHLNMVVIKFGLFYFSSWNKLP